MTDFVEIKMPDSQTEGTQSFVAKWLKQVGESIKMHEPLLEISTDKVIMELPAPADGVLREILKAENDQVEPGTVLGMLEPALFEGETNKSANRTSTAECRAGSTTQELSPAVRKLIQQHSLDSSLISGTGRGGRITVQDVEQYIQHSQSDAVESDSAGRSRRIKHSPMRLSVAQHMVTSMLQTAPHVTSVFEADLTAVLAHREKVRGDFESRGTKLTLTAYLVMALVSAVKKVPEVNSRWHSDSLEVFDDVNIGVAAALPSGGLVVPVIKGVQDMSLEQIAGRLQDLTSRAREGRLTSGEVRGGTLTITNHGVSGSLIATPIINQPQSAILGVGKLERRPKVVSEGGKETITIRSCAYITLTIDHRVLDGFQANTFLTEYLEALSKVA